MDLKLLQKIEEIGRMAEELKSSEAKKKLDDSKNLPSIENIEDAFKTNPANFLNYCHRKNVFEFFTKEYVDALASYILSRKEILKPKGKLKVLEIGAGNGALSFFLNKRFSGSGVKSIATDSGEWKLETGVYPVENISHVEAIEKHNPDIIIFSWMPRKVDITLDFFPVKEYILIGAPEHCANAKTWLSNKKYKSVLMKDLHKLQICQLDIIGLGLPSKSITKSFRRRK